MAESPVPGTDPTGGSWPFGAKRTSDGGERTDAGPEDERMEPGHVERKPQGRRRKRKRKRKERQERSQERGGLVGRPTGIPTSSRVAEPPSPEDMEEDLPELGPSEDEDHSRPMLAPRVSVHDGVLGTTGWQQKMEVLLAGRPRLDDLGRMLVEQFIKLDTPLGQFTRARLWSSHATATDHRGPF